MLIFFILLLDIFHHPQAHSCSLDICVILGLSLRKVGLYAHVPL